MHRIGQLKRFLIFKTLKKPTIKQRKQKIQRDFCFFFFIFLRGEYKMNCIKNFYFSFFLLWIWTLDRVMGKSSKKKGLKCASLQSVRVLSNWRTLPCLTLLLLSKAWYFSAFCCSSISSSFKQKTKKEEAKSKKQERTFFPNMQTTCFLVLSFLILFF